MARSLILIIDNDPESTASLSDALEEEGYEVVSVRTAEQGLGKIRERHPGLIIGSISLPAENFLALCRTIRKDHLLPEIPVLVLLPEEARYEPGYGESYGIVDALSRPVDVAEAVRLAKDHSPPEAVTVDSDTDWLGLNEDAEKPVIAETLDEVSKAGPVPEAAEVSETDEASSDAGVLKAGDDSPVEMTLPFADRAEAEDDETGKFGEEADEPEEPSSFFSRLHTQTGNDPAERLHRELRESVDISRRKKLIYIGTVCLVLGIAAGFFIFSGDDESTTEIKPDVVDIREPEIGEDLVTEETPARDPFEEVIKADLEREEAEPQAERQRTAEREPERRAAPPPPAPVNAGPVYAVQVGAFMVEENALVIRRKLELKGFPVSIIKQRFRDGRVLHRVLVGRFDGREDAKEQLRLLADVEGIAGMVTKIPD